MVIFTRLSSLYFTWIFHDCKTSSSCLHHSHNDWTEYSHKHTLSIRKLLELYNFTKIETRQAELSQHLAASNKPLPVQAISPENSVLIHFWWDNCDCEKENLQGSVHTTHGVAFQGISSGTTMETNGTEITPSGKRTLTPATSCIHPVTVNQKMPPNRSMIVKWTKTFSAMMSF